MLGITVEKRGKESLTAVFPSSDPVLFSVYFQKVRTFIIFSYFFKKIKRIGVVYT